MGREGLSGNQLAFRVNFTNGDQGIYIATIPEPSTAMLMGYGLCVLAGLKRHKRASSAPPYLSEQDVAVA